MNIVERAKSKWNKQANEYNQWAHLGTEEKLDLIIAEESSAGALLEEAVNQLDFRLEEREGVWVILWANGGVEPAGFASVSLWEELIYCRDILRKSVSYIEYDHPKSEIEDFLAKCNKVLGGKSDE